MINLAGKELNEIDVADDCTWLSPPYERQSPGRAGVSGPRPGVVPYFGDNGLHGFTIATPSSLKHGQSHSITVKYESTNTNLGATPKSVTCATTPNYVGYLDAADCNHIYGWAADKNRLNTSINVSIYDGSTWLQTVLANGSRPDVGSYLGDNGLHAFTISLPDILKNNGPHKITARLKSRDTQVPNGKSMTYPTAASYEGYLDFADCDQIYRWASDRNLPNTPINVSIYSENQFMQTVLANGSMIFSKRSVTLGRRSHQSCSLRRNGQTTAPTITAYSWNSTPMATQPFSGTITGNGFDRGAHVFLVIGNRGSTPLSYSPIRWVERTNSPIILALPAEQTNNLIFWVSVFGMIVSPISTIITLILTWISLHRRKAEAILLRLEIEKQRLEIEKLRIELERMRVEPTTQTPSLLFVPS